MSGSVKHFKHDLKILYNAGGIKQLVRDFAELGLWYLQ